MLTADPERKDVSPSGADQRDSTAKTTALLVVLMLTMALVALSWLLIDTPHGERTLHDQILGGGLVAMAGLSIVILRRIRKSTADLRAMVARLAESDKRQRAMAEESDALRNLLIDAVDSIDEGFVLFDHENRLVVCNDRYRQAYPSIADILQPGTRFDDILTTAAERLGMAEGTTGRDLQHWVHQRMRRHLEQKAFTECSLSDGHWYRISERPTRSGGIVKVLMDITAAKEHERDLAHKNELLETVFDAMSQGLAVFDGDQRLIAWNERFARVMGYPVGLLKGSSSAEDFRNFDDQRQVNALPVASLSEQARAGHEMALPDGRFIEADVNPMPRGGFVATFADVTARRQAELALQQSQKMDAIGQLAGGIAHEFNNMLTSIGGFARMALRTPDDSERVVMCLNEVTKAADRAASLTGQLLNFSRRTADEDIRPLRLKDLMKDLSGFLRPLLSERIQVKITIDDPDLTVSADAPRLHQAIVNLCINARDAMAEDSSGDITIHVARMAADAAFAERHPQVSARELAKISVRDTGCGIAPAILDRIFEPFFTTKEQGKGTGLGLPQVYSTTEHLGGAVEVASEAGAGSTFTLYLPLLTTVGDGSQPDEPHQTVNGDGFTILLAEDEDSVRRYLTMTLEDCGFTVLTATDGEDALAIYHDAGDLVDALITDVVMPRLDGPNLAKRLLAETPSLPVIFLSGYSAEDSWKLLADAPNRAFIGKPVAPDTLLETLAGFLGLPQADLTS